MPVNEYEYRCEKDDKYKVRYKREVAERKLFEKNSPKKPDQRTKKGQALFEAWHEKYIDKIPHGGYWHDCDSDMDGEREFPQRDYYEPFNKDSVYYDDAMEYMNKETKRFNRLAMIIQGIFDRSEMLHPHPPVQVWEEESFNRSVKLIHDASANLYQGEEPDIEAYMNKNHSGFGVDSVFIGQQKQWLSDNAEKENERRSNSYNHRYESCHLTTYQNYGDRGPTEVARPQRWSKKKQTASFSWNRERRVYDRYKDDHIRTTCTIEGKHLFDLSQYKRNDYKIFLDDPRTRSKYMEWAGKLIMGELYLDGKLEIAKPVSKD